MGITIEDAGVFTTLQDAGRTGYQQFGVSVSGAMDMEAFRLANLLAGNDRDEGALEMTYKGPSIRFEEDEVIAVTGADMRPVLNGESVPVYTALAVRAGDLLEMGTTYLRESDRKITGYITYTVEKEPTTERITPFEMDKAGDFTRNHSWTVLVMFEGGKLRILNVVNIAVREWNNQNTDPHEVYNW